MLTKSKLVRQELVARLIKDNQRELGLKAGFIVLQRPGNYYIYTARIPKCYNVLEQALEIIEPISWRSYE